MIVTHPTITGNVYEVSIRSRAGDTPRLWRMCKSCRVMFDATERPWRRTCGKVCENICRVSANKRRAK